MSKRKRTGRVKYSPKVMEMIRDNKGLPKYTSVGGYPMFYYAVDSDGRNMEEVCHTCASGRGGLGSGDKIVEGEVNWEDPDLFCAGCNKRIESAYAD
jgi:hypothetical protein